MLSIVVDKAQTKTLSLFTTPVQTAASRKGLYRDLHAGLIHHDYPDQ